MSDGEAGVDAYLAALEEGGHLVRDALGRVRDQGPDPCTQVGQGPTSGVVCQGGQVGVDPGLSVAHGCCCARSGGRLPPVVQTYRSRMLDSASRDKPSRTALARCSPTPSTAISSSMPAASSGPEPVSYTH